MLDLAVILGFSIETKPIGYIHKFIVRNGFM